MKALFTAKQLEMIAEFQRDVAIDSGRSSITTHDMNRASEFAAKNNITFEMLNAEIDELSDAELDTLADNSGMEYIAFCQTFREFSEVVHHVLAVEAL